MPTELELLDELLADESTAGSIDNTIKVFPDESKLDENKTSGRKHRALLKAVVTRLKAWVMAMLEGKADLVDGKVAAEQLPEFSSNFTAISENQHGTHPAFSSQHQLNVYLLGGQAPTPDTTPPTAPQGTIISNITETGYTATADTSTDE
ncbi:hypothetical protein [Pontibacter sp. H249]|uniref:hypothetical protein n=1 Tax=Pontibacter sp. H249 TaxID=3133420 RepID=UPI0030BD44DC